MQTQNPVNQPPIIPGTSNTKTSFVQIAKIPQLTVSERLGLFGAAPVGQQNVAPSFDSIITLLQSFGIAAKYYVQQGTKLIGSAATGPSAQGVSVALSGDGSTLAIGGNLDSSYVGAVWIFIKGSDGTWSQQAKLVGTGYIGSSILQGSSVSLSADGSTLAFGGTGDNNGIGATWVFNRSGNTWIQQAKLVGSGYVGSSDINQGSSVSLSADSNTLAIGTPNDNSQIGCTFIFVRQNGSWSQQARLIGTGYTGTYANQGGSVSLSGDGNVLAVGAYGDNNSIGATWIFYRKYGTMWIQQGQKLIGTGYDDTLTVQQGWSVSLSRDATTLAVGGLYDTSGLGATWIFTQTMPSGLGSGTWTQQGSKLVGIGAVDASRQGYSVSVTTISNNTNIDAVLAVGGYLDNSNTGAVWTFTRKNSVWSLLGPKLVGTGSTGSANQGSSVALSTDGTTIASGGYSDNSGDGATWIFDR
jgi:hypothetical protein